METQFNLFGFKVQVSVSRTRLYLIRFTPSSDMFAEPTAHDFALTRLGAYYKAWSGARFWAKHDGRSYRYAIYWCGEEIDSRVLHQETVSKVSFFSSKPLNK